MASINTSSPPYTPKQAAARAKEAPKGHASGVGSSTSNWGSGGAAKAPKKGKAFKPGLRAGPREGKHG
jgi:hypothetical protein